MSYKLNCNKANTHSRETYIITNMIPNMEAEEIVKLTLAYPSSAASSPRLWTALGTYKGSSFRFHR
jgi:hypothetical protein